MSGLRGCIKVWVSVNVRKPYEGVVRLRREVMGKDGKG